MNEHETRHASTELIARVVAQRKWADPEDVRALSARLATNDPDASLADALFRASLIDKNQQKTLRELEELPLEIDGYRLSGLIGTGAMGVVLLADGAHGERVALKLINKRYADDEEFIQRFLRETKAATSLDHEHIARAMSSGDTGDLLYLAMEYVEGPSLAEVIKAHGPMPEGFALSMMMQAARGLAYAWENATLVHRDVKPENMLLTRPVDPDNPFDVSQQVKIIDFGLAKIVDTEENLTMTGITMGTPHYMSPEQITGEKTLDCRSDIYSLGASLYHALTGRTPFRGGAAGAIMMAHVNEPVPDPREIVPAVQEQTVSVIHTAMAKAREERFTTFDAFILACEKVAWRADSQESLLKRPLARSKPHPAAKARSRRSASDRQRFAGDPAATTAKAPLLDDDQPQTSAEEALRRMQTDRIRERTDRHTRKKRASAPAIQVSSQGSIQRPRLERSAAFDEDIDARQASTGVLPWLTLALAILALGGLLLYRLLGE